MAETSLNSNFKKHVSTTTNGIQKLLSSKTIPLWVNPNNVNFYHANPYNAGDIVVLLSDINEIFYWFRHYFESIATNIGVKTDFFFEKNNPEFDDELINTLIYGGYIGDQYLNPMTMVSKSEKGFGLYVSMKDQNYDIPGSSDSWFNLDMSESLDGVQLQISRIISILTSNGYIDKLTGSCTNPINGDSYGDETRRYLDNRMEMHKQFYHFGGDFGGDVEKAMEKMDEIQAEIESQVNTTTSVMRNPFLLNGEIAGNMMTIIQTTGQMFYYCILDATKLERDKNITINFTPSLNSNILVPLVLNTSGGLITVDNPDTDPNVLTSDGKRAWYAESFVQISNEAGSTNNITIETNEGFDEANFNNNFNGFLDNAYVATYTPIGIETRTEKVAIHCSPVREISRTNKSLTLQLSSDYVWQYSALAISLSGQCEVNQ